jgi:GT2 family glycosyltransferase
MRLKARSRRLSPRGQALTAARPAAKAPRPAGTALKEQDLLDLRAAASARHARAGWSLPATRRRSSVTAIVVAYHAGREIMDCLQSLRTGKEADPEIIVVANGSLDPEVEAAIEDSPARLISLERNLGFGAACNLAASAASGRVLVFVNPDVIVAADAVDQLRKTLEDEAIGVAMARLRLLDDPDRLNSSGNVLHITGLGWVGDYGAPVDSARDIREVAFPSGAAMAVRTDVFRALGGFREEIFLYHEDVDLGWRAHMAGYRVVMTPTADAYHDYAFDRNPRKLYYLERNRVAFLLCDFSVRLLIVLAPVLLAAEMAMAVLAWREGWLRDKVAGWAWCARNARALFRRRRETQRLRRVADREIANLLTPVIDPRVISVPLVLRLVNPLLATYWAVAKRAL